MGYYIHEAPKVGDVFTANNGEQYEVIEYMDSTNVTVRFFKTGYINTTATVNIRKGSVGDPLLPRLHGNFIGIGPHNEGNSPTVNYRWKGIHERSGYSGGIITVCDEWLNYQNFYAWSEKQIGHNSKEYEIDKDLLVPGNTLYSPETSCYLPGKINSLKFNRTTKENGYPMGVSDCKLTGKYRVRWRDANGVAWEERVLTLDYAIEMIAETKRKTILLVAEEYKSRIDPRAYQALVHWNIHERMLDSVASRL